MTFKDKRIYVKLKDEHYNLIKWKFTQEEINQINFSLKIIALRYAQSNLIHRRVNYNFNPKNTCFTLNEIVIHPSLNKIPNLKGGGGSYGAGQTFIIKEYKINNNLVANTIADGKDDKNKYYDDDDVTIGEIKESYKSNNS